jgi:hypothetical protein
MHMKHQVGDDVAQLAPVSHQAQARTAGPSGSRGLPEITHERLRCPRCGSARLRRFRSIADQGDGTSLAWVRCLDEECAHRFRVILQ